MSFRHRQAEAVTMEPAAGDTGAPGERRPSLAPSSLELLSRAWVPGAYQALIGTVAELAPVLGPTIAARITGPFLGLFALDEERDELMLVVSGRDDGELAMAAAAFASPRQPLPEAPSIVLTGPAAEPAGDPAAAPRAALAPGGRYRFDDLGTAFSVTANGTEPRIAVDLPPPPDFFAADTRKALVRLNFSYGPGLVPGSVVNVLVNGAYRAPIPLAEPDGASVRDYVVAIPINRLRAGRNTIAFEPLAGENPALGCSSLPSLGHSVTIDGSSTVTLPTAARVAHQPDLHLFASTGFPYVDPAHAGEAELVVAAQDSATVAAAWSLLGKLAQLAGRPLDGLALSGGQVRPGRHAIVVGPLDSLDPALLEAAPVDLAGLLAEPARGPVVAALAHALPSEALGPIAVAAACAERSWTVGESWFRSLAEALPAPSSQPVAAPDAVLAAFESPYGRGHTATVVTAHDGPALLRAMRELVSPALWRQLDGDTVLWSTASRTVESRSVAATFRLGSVPRDLRQRLLFVDSVFARRPQLWVAAALGGLIFFAGLTWAGLVLHERRR